MAGLARSAPEPEAGAREGLDVADATGMPVDARGFWESPIASSYPACPAAVAAREPGLAAPLLRRLRVGLRARRERLDTPEAGAPGALRDGRAVERRVGGLVRLRPSCPAGSSSWR